MVKITKRCMLCGKPSTLEVTEKIAEMYDRYLAGFGMIQDIPLPANEREFLMTGMCEACQEYIFTEDEEEE